MPQSTEAFEIIPRIFFVKELLAIFAHGNLYILASRPLVSLQRSSIILHFLEMTSSEYYVEFLVSGGHLFCVCLARSVQENWIALGDDFRYNFVFDAYACSDNGYPLMRQFTDLPQFHTFST